MKIVLISAEFPPENGWGGIATYTYYMALGLLRAGHEVSVVAKGKPGVSHPYGFPVYRVNISNFAYYLMRIGFRSRFLLRTFARLQSQAVVARKIRTLERQGIVDIVEYPDSYAEGFLHRVWCKSPYVVRLHLPFSFVYPFYREEVQSIQWMERHFVRQANAIVSPSRCLAEWTSQKCAIATPVEVIPNPIDVQEFRPAMHEGGSYVLCNGWLSPYKGTDVLLQSIALVKKYDPGTKFVFAGKRVSGGKASVFAHRLDFLLESLDLADQVSFLGHMDHSQMPEIYRNAMFSVLASRWENYPYAVIESFASGRAVIGTRVGGLPELIHDGDNGLLCQKDDPADLARCILEALNNPEWRIKAGLRARKFVTENCSLPSITKRVVDFYESVL